MIVINGEPGLKNLDIVVNGQKFRVAGLGDGEMTVIDVSSVVEYGSYATYELTAEGRPSNQRRGRETGGRLSTESREAMTSSCAL